MPSSVPVFSRKFFFSGNSEFREFPNSGRIQPSGIFSPGKKNSRREFFFEKREFLSNGRIFTGKGPCGSIRLSGICTTRMIRVFFSSPGNPVLRENSPPGGHGPFNESPRHREIRDFHVFPGKTAPGNSQDPEIRFRNGLPGDFSLRPMHRHPDGRIFAQKPKEPPKRPSCKTCLHAEAPRQRKEAPPDAKIIKTPVVTPGKARSPAESKTGAIQIVSGEFSLLKNSQSPGNGNSR